jgi:hypothetical protein
VQIIRKDSSFRFIPCSIVICLHVRVSLNHGIILKKQLFPFIANYGCRSNIVLAKGLFDMI